MITVQDEKSVFEILKQINAQDALKGSTPLMEAIEFNNSYKLVEALLQAGASIHTKDFIGNTALHFAALENRKDVVQLLMAKGAEKDVVNAEGRKPLDLATDPAIVDLLQ